MPKVRVTLSIGYSDAERGDILTIPDDEWNSCETDREREELMQAYWNEWAYNYIDGRFELMEE